MQTQTELGVGATELIQVIVVVSVMVVVEMIVTVVVENDAVSSVEV